MAELQGVLVFILLEPVGTFPTLIYLVENLLRNKAAPVGSGSVSIEVGLIDNLHVLLSINSTRHLVGVRPTYETIILYLNLTGLTLLGGYQNHTIGSTGTIDGSRGGILQYIDALDIIRIQTVQTVISCTSIDTVDNQQRRTFTDGTDTTDIYLKALTRLRRCLGDVHTRRRSLHGSQCVGGVQLGDVLTLHLNGSTGNQLFLLDTVTYNHHFLEHGVVVLHRNLEVVLITNLDFLSFESDERYNDRCTRFHIESEVTVKVSNRTIRGTLFHYAGSDNGTHSVDYRTCNLLRCLLNLLRSSCGMSVR